MKGASTISQCPKGHRMVGPKGSTGYLPSEKEARAAYAKLTKPKAKPKAKNGE